MVNRKLQFSFVLVQVVFVQSLSFGLRATLSYAVLDAGGSGAILGVLTAAFALPSLLLALPVGNVMDRVGERPMLATGPLAMLAASGLALLSLGNVPVLILSTALVGIGHLCSVVSTQAVLANRFLTSKADSMFGYYTFAASIGQAIGPLAIAIPGPRPEIPPFNAILLMFIVLSCVQFASSFLIRSTHPQKGERRKGSMLESTKNLLKVRGVIQALVATSIVLTTIDLFVVYVPLLGHERGILPAVVSAMLVARACASTFSRFFLGVMVSRFGRRTLTVFSIAASAITLAVIPIPLPDLVLVAISVVYGFFIGTCQPITLSWISQLAPTGTRGLAMSLRIAANRVGQTLLPFGLGAIAAGSGATGVLLGSAGLLSFATWMSAALPDKAPEDESYEDDE